MPKLHHRSIDYDEFAQRVRRHRPCDVLPAIARSAIAKFFTKDYMQPPLVVTPWALAGCAITSIVAGNKYRTPGVSDQDVLEMCAAHNAIAERALARHEPGSAVKFFLRVLYEQGAYQHRGAQEIHRSGALFIDTLASYEGPALEVISDAVWRDLLGCSLDEYIDIGWLVYGGVMSNQGYFDRAWLDADNFAVIREKVPAPTISRVLETFVATPQQLREQSPLLSTPKESRKYAFNPLVSRPLVDMTSCGDPRLLAPQPHFVVGRVSPNGLYYAGMAKYGTAFSRDVGRLFEAYVGQQLRLLRDAAVHPEFEYGPRRQRVKSVDYFVVFDDLVLLVEAKTGRARQPTRMGDDALLVDDFDRTLGDAYRQINRDAAALRANTTGFDHIPGDRPLHGLVVTLEPFHAGNATRLAGDLLPDTEVPITVAESRELEGLTALGTVDRVGDLFRQLVQGNEQTLALGPVLSGRDIPKNPLLVAADRRSVWRP